MSNVLNIVVIVRLIISVIFLINLASVPWGQQSLNYFILLAFIVGHEIASLKDEVLRLLMTALGLMCLYLKLEGHWLTIIFLMFTWFNIALLKNLKDHSSLALTSFAIILWGMKWMANLEIGGELQLYLPVVLLGWGVYATISAKRPMFLLVAMALTTIFSHDLQSLMLYGFTTWLILELCYSPKRHKMITIASVTLAALVEVSFPIIAIAIYLVGIPTGKFINKNTLYKLVTIFMMMVALVEITDQVMIAIITLGMIYNFATVLLRENKEKHV